MAHGWVCPPQTALVFAILWRTTGSVHHGRPLGLPFCRRWLGVFAIDGPRVRRFVAKSQVRSPGTALAFTFLWRTARWVRHRRPLRPPLCGGRPSASTTDNPWVRLFVTNGQVRLPRIAPACGHLWHMARCNRNKQAYGQGFTLGYTVVCLFYPPSVCLSPISARLKFVDGGRLVVNVDIQMSTDPASMNL